MSGLIGLGLAAGLLNYAVFSLTGFPIVWCFLLAVAKPLAFYVQLVNLGLVAGVIFGGIFFGHFVALKMVVAFLAFNLVPAVAQAVFGLGGSCF